MPTIRLVSGSQPTLKDQCGLRRRSGQYRRPCCADDVRAGIDLRTAFIHEPHRCRYVECPHPVEQGARQRYFRNSPGIVDNFAKPHANRKRVIDGYIPAINAICTSYQLYSLNINCRSACPDLIGGYLDRTRAWIKRDTRHYCTPATRPSASRMTVFGLDNCSITLVIAAKASPCMSIIGFITSGLVSSFTASAAVCSACCTDAI